MEHSEFREEIELAEDHPYSYDHTEPKGSALFIFGGITIVLLIVVTIGITAYYDATREEQLVSKVLTVENDQLKNLRATEARELHSYGYLDKNTGKVRVTIDRAMELVAQESAENRVKYPTNPYAVKTAEQLAGQAPPVSPAGAAAALDAQKQGASSNPNVQQPSTPNR